MGVPGPSKTIYQTLLIDLEGVIMGKLQYHACYFALVWLLVGVSAKATTQDKIYYFEPEVELLEG